MARNFKKISEGNIVLWVILGLILVFLAALFIFNLNNKSDQSSTTRPPKDTGHHASTGAWHENMLLGAKDAPNKLVEYSDYFCSYCADFLEQAGSEQFKKDYIDSGKLSYEVRVITILSEKSPNTEQGAEAAFCAADQAKFFEYSENIVPRIKTDFFDKGIGVKTVANPKAIDKLPISYFQESAKNVSLDVDKFTTCMEDGVYKNKALQNTNRALNLGVNGLPFFVVNDYQTSGFQGGYDGLEMMLRAGGVK